MGRSGTHFGREDPSRPFRLAQWKRRAELNGSVRRQKRRSQKSKANGLWHDQHSTGGSRRGRLERIAEAVLDGSFRRIMVVTLSIFTIFMRVLRSRARIGVMVLRSFGM